MGQVGSRRPEFSLRPRTFLAARDRSGKWWRLPLAKLLVSVFGERWATLLWWHHQKRAKLIQFRSTTMHADLEASKWCKIKLEGESEYVYKESNWTFSIHFQAADWSCKDYQSELGNSSDRLLEQFKQFNRSRAQMDSNKLHLYCRRRNLLLAVLEFKWENSSLRNNYNHSSREWKLNFSPTKCALLFLYLQFDLAIEKL